MRFLDFIKWSRLTTRLLTGALIVVGCDDILEKDITDKEIFLIAPSNAVELDSGNITFLWEFLEGADTYELLVLSPNFDEPITVHADTALADNTFTTALGEGTYSWGVRGVNSAYNTDYFINDFVVNLPELDPDISAFTVNYVSPLDSSEADSGSVVFLWDFLEDARNYRFRLVRPSFAAITELVADTLTADNQFTLSLDSGTYQWRVIGINRQSRTEPIDRTLFVD